MASRAIGRGSIKAASTPILESQRFAHSSSSCTTPYVRFPQPDLAVARSRRQRPLKGKDRDRGTPRGATPPTPPGIRITYHGGSTGLGLARDIESGETEGGEVAVWQGLLDRRVSGHAPEPRRRTGGDRGIELRYAATAQFVEAVVPVLPLPPKIRA